MTTLSEAFQVPTLAPIAGKPRKVGNNTFEYRTEDGRVVTRLHRTDVAITHPDGSVTLNSNGWRTVTTKDRMNAAISHLGCVVRSVKGSWSIWNCRTNTSTPFTDFMTVRP